MPFAAIASRTILAESKDGLGAEGRYVREVLPRAVASDLRAACAAKPAPLGGLGQSSRGSPLRHSPTPEPASAGPSKLCRGICSRGWGAYARRLRLRHVGRHPLENFRALFGP